MTTPDPALSPAPSTAATSASNRDVDRVRAVVRTARADLVESDASPDAPEVRLLAALIDLLELAADDAAGVEAMNARTRARADRVGGDGHTWVMHRSEWPAALRAAQAWEDGDRG